ncbi:unnamed protein product, partial [marine sediment metagenome]
DTLQTLLDDKGEQGLKKLTQMTSGMGAGFVSPRVVKDFEVLYDVITDPKAPRAKAETTIARAMQYLPFVDMSKGRKMFDVFGRPVPSRLSTAQIISKVDSDEDVQYYLKQGYYRPAVSMNSGSFTLEDKRGETVRRKLNPKKEKEATMFNAYEMAVGKKFHDKVKELKDDGLKGEEFVDEMTREWIGIQKEVKADIYDWSRDHRVDYDKKANIVD